MNWPDPQSNLHPDAWLKVGELARRTGLTVRTLHHYDEIGLLTPSGRSEAGYRQYSRTDVARLHGIQALRHLGLSLADIAGVLDGGELTPGAVVAQQMAALDKEIAHATELRGRLGLLHDGLIAGTDPDMSDWLDTLALMTTFGKYFSAAELKRIFGNWRLIEPEWLALTARVREAMDRKLPIDAPQLQPLANRWMALMLHWMEGDLDLLERWGVMYDQEPGAHGRNHAPPSDMIAYMRQAIDLRRALIGKYLRMDEIQHLGFVPLAEWQALEGAVWVLLRDRVQPSSPAAQAALKRWDGLMNQLANDDAALRAKLQAAWAAEPVLAAGSPLSPPVRDYLQQCSIAVLDPHVT